MIIDCHGHYTTEPADLHRFRKDQVDNVKDPSKQPPKSSLKVSDDEIRESLEGASADLRRQGIELTLREGTLPSIHGSRAPLAHAFSNIVSNAIEAMPQGGRLRIESRTTDNGSIEIAIEDTGVGMPARVARRAFRPLFTTKPNGVGLGLSLARRIVERHAGRIDLDSVAGCGTRVVLTLPTGA